jgi:hypothetical protein
MPAEQRHHVGMQHRVALFRLALDRLAAETGLQVRTKGRAAIGQFADQRIEGFEQARGARRSLRQRGRWRPTPTRISVGVYSPDAATADPLG